MSFVFAPFPQAQLPVEGSSDQFPIRRIFCVGRNYADHVVEMGGDPDRDEPFFFTKPADAATLAQSVSMPPRTQNLHHEMELVIAMGKPGKDIPLKSALGHIFGYGAGVDLTRRDLQAWAKEKGRPWDMAKGFDNSAPMSAINPADTIGHPDSGRIHLTVNGKLKQDGDLNQQIWKVPEIVAFLSTFVQLEAGDLIMTGTPAGVAALEIGDEVYGEIEGVGHVSFKIAA